MALQQTSLRPAGTKVLLSDDGRGNATATLRAFKKGEVIFQEPPLALVYSSYDAPWLKAMRAELEKQSEACAWQLCVAVHCLTEEELPKPAPEGLVPMTAAARAQMEELCGVDYPPDLEPSELAETAARHLVAASPGAKVADPVALRHSLDTLGARISRNGFQIMDLSRRPPTSADGLFHRISFINHCCAGLNNASWTWDGREHLITVKASRDIAEGEELSISYIAKPWCDLGKQARQKYLQQNFNFTCLCKACTLPPEEEELLRQQLSEQRNVKPPKEPLGKLANLLTRWMQDGHGGACGDDDGANRESKGSQAPAPPKEKKPLTDEDRIARILVRCDTEGMEVSKEQAQTALLAEEGHVGKTMIRLRRQRKEGTVEAGASSATAGHQAAAEPAKIRQVPFMVLIIAAFSIGAVVHARKLHRK